MENKEKPEISEEVRQWFKAHNDERVERQKKIISELTKKNNDLKMFNNTLITANNQFLARLRKWPFHGYVNWDRLCIIALKMGFAIIVIILIIDALSR